MQNLIFNQVGLLDHPAFSKHSFLEHSFKILAGKHLFLIILLTNNFWLRLNPMQNLILNQIGVFDHPAFSKHSLPKLSF